MAEATSVLAIIGGGRWGQVQLSVVATMYAPFNRIVIVSKTNAEEVNEKIAELNLTSHIPIEILPTIDDLFAKYIVKAALVVNAAKQHFETARQLIKRGVHVLIEKPIVTSINEIQILIEEATQYNVKIIPGLNYRFCSYIKNFALAVSKKGLPNKFYLKWTDARNEMRHGRVKRHDTSISVVQDVMPHIWTILSVIFQHPEIKIRTCLRNDNSAAALTLSINNIEGHVLLERNGIKRERYLSLQYNNKSLDLDFSFEPGIIRIGSKEVSGDILWKQKSSPLALQLKYFFSIIESDKSINEDLKCCLNSVSCTEAALLFNESSKQEVFV